MLQVTLGRTGLTVNKNGFGALPIQRVGFAQAATILKKAYDAGVTYFDTARAYSDSEEKMGLALASVRENIVIATKTAATTADGLWADLAESLAKLRTEYIDIYQLHNPAFCPVPGDESGLYDALLKAKAQGKIRHIGITNHRLRVAEEAINSGLYETLQFPFNYLSGEAELRLVQRCAEENIGFVAMKGLSGGLLTDAPTVYNWMAQYPTVLPIWGVQSVQELEDFLACQTAPPTLTAAQSARVEKDRAELAGAFCRGCGYCMPCPAGIEINNCARMSLLLRRSPAAGWLTGEWRQKMEQIESCIECGQCKRQCPYGLDTPNLLKQNLADYRTFL